MGRLPMGEFRRVNFQLPKGLAREFMLKSRREGLTRADLLRKWLLCRSGVELASVDNRFPLATFNLRLEMDAWHLLCGVCNELGVKRSLYLRLLIGNFLRPPVPALFVRSDPKLAEVKKLWFEGRHDEVICRLSERVSNLELGELAFLARAYVQLGDLKEGSRVLDVLEERCCLLPVGHTMVVKMRVSRANIARLTRNIPLSKSILQNVLHDLPLSNHTLQQAKLSSIVHAQLGVVAGIEEDFAGSVEHSELALERMGPDDSPVSYLKSYLRLVDLHLAEQNYDLAVRYIHRVNTKVAQVKSDDPKLKAFIHNRKALYKLKSGDFAGAGADVAQALAWATSAGLPLEQLYAYENLGKLALMQNDWNVAYSWLDKAEAVETSIRQGNDLGRPRFLKLFIESRHNPKAITQLEQVSLRPRPPYPSLISYLTASAKFLSPSSSHHHEAGRISLMYLSNFGKYPLLRLSAQKMLESKLVFLPI